MSAAEEPPSAIRSAYEEYGPEEYYRRFGAEYRTPPEDGGGGAIPRSAEPQALSPPAVPGRACGRGGAAPGPAVSRWRRVAVARRARARTSPDTRHPTCRDCARCSAGRSRCRPPGAAPPP